MKKSFLLSASLFCLIGMTSLYADEFDDLFLDDNVVEMEETNPSDAVSSDLSHGILFQTGSVKISGSYDMSLTTYTKFYDGSLDEQKSFGDNLAETSLSPKADALLSVDARPKSYLRFYTKFGISYPYSVKANSVPTGKTTPVSTQSLFPEVDISSYPLLPKTAYLPVSATVIQDFFSVKELFADFSLADIAFFRFGLHTVTWGAGVFFSPVSDMINTSSINPEDTDLQVNGSLNLRTQIVFPGSQNCLWFYVIPDSVANTPTYENYSSYTTAQYIDISQYPYDARKTALALKGDLVLGTWELGAGGFYKYQSAPKAMLTASGPVFGGRLNLFGEAVYRYGSDVQWKDKPDEWNDKTNIFQATAGFRYFDKPHSILYMAQYYFDGNDDDHKYYMKGHNIAATINFGRIGTTCFTANLHGLFNFGKEVLPTSLTDFYKILSEGKQVQPYCAIISATMNYSPIDELTIGLGPYITWSDWEKAPTVAMKFTVKLGNGKF